MTGAAGYSGRRLAGVKQRGREEEEGGRQGGGWKSSSISSWWIGTDTGKLYTLFIWPCFPYARIILKTTSVGRGVRRKGSFLPLNNTRAVRADLCSTKVSARGEEHTLSCVTHDAIRGDTPTLPCTQTHVSTRTYAHTHTDTHTESSYTSASVSCRYNLQSDTWRSANNYKAIKQANPGGVETTIKKATRRRCRFYIVD